jgi:hypothetical protein
MKTNKSILGTALAIVLAAVATQAGATCRDLVEGEPYYGSWKSCCDIAGGTSGWVETNGDGKTKVYNGSCLSWGIKDVAPTVSGPVCRDLVEGEPYFAGWKSCCDEGNGRSLWVRRWGGGKAESYSGDCRYWGIK